MTASVPFLDYTQEHRAIRADFLKAVGRIVDSGRFTLGPEVELFEKAFAEYCGVSHAVAVNSGTSALIVALLAAGVGRGDEVIIPAMTFVATATAVLSVVADVNQDSYCLDPERLASAFTTRTKAILPVHLYGRLADMDAVGAFARSHGLTVIEDAAQAHGARRGGIRAGAFGDAGCFSFYPGKNLGGAGEGGLIATNDLELAQRARQLRDWGQEEKGVYSAPGSNYRMDALQAAFLSLKLPALDAWIESRRSAAATYRTRLSALPIVLPDAPGESHVFHIYSVLHPERNRLRRELAGAKVSTGLHYPRAVHEQPALAGYRRAGDLSVAERIAREQLSLPIFPAISEMQIDRVCGALSRALRA